MAGVPGAAARGSSVAKLEGPVDFEFLGLISDILRLVEPGEQSSAANADVVKDKVEELQAKFARAKTELESMDGADMTPQMQEDMFDLYALLFFLILLLPGVCADDSLRGVRARARAHTFLRAQADDSWRGGRACTATGTKTD